MFDLTLLYAEDNDQSRKSYVLGLKQYFKQVIEAKNGEEALSLYHKYQPDILLTDISMPLLDGLELIRAIREKNKTIKIIVLSAHSDSEKLLKAIPMGLSAYLVKPVMRDALKKSLMDAVSDIKKSSHVDFPNGDKFDVAGHTLISDGVEHVLTNKEYLMVRLLQENVPHPLSYEELAYKMWEDPVENSYGKIQNIIKRIRKKSPTLISSVYGFGYKINPSKKEHKSKITKV